MTEWRDVVGFEGLYRVSDDGVVVGCKRGKRRATHVVGGYEHIVLFKNGRLYNSYVHLLVLIAFVGPRPPGLECRHGDNNRLNNKLSNLCWGTRIENAQDKERHGSAPTLENNPKAKLTNAQVLEIFARACAGEMIASIAVDFSISEATISNIRNGRTWSKLTGSTENLKRVHLNDALVGEMQRLRDAGNSLDEVARLCAVSKATVFRHTVREE